MDMNEVLVGGPLDQQGSRVVSEFLERPEEDTVAWGLKIIAVIEQALEVAHEEKVPSIQTPGDARMRAYRFVRSAFFVERPGLWMPGETWNQALYSAFQAFIGLDQMADLFGRRMKEAKDDLERWKDQRTLKDSTTLFFASVSLIARDARR